jgi:uncharacterized RDD family membrane protein YckC
MTGQQFFMECPACGLTSTDESAVCPSCGQPSYMGGASIDTTAVDQKGKMIVAGNLDFPIPSSGNTISFSETDDEPTTVLKDGTISQTENFDKAPPLLSEELPPLFDAPSPMQIIPPAHMIYAGFWYRFLARILDTVVLAVMLGMLTAVVLAISPELSPMWDKLVIAGFVLSLLYFVLGESSGKQGTFGKQMAGLKVTDANGGRLSFMHAFGRYVAHFISMLPLGFGCLLSVFTSRQQTLHDLIAKTLVLHEAARPGDLKSHPAMPAREMQRVTVLMVWVMSVLLLVTAVVVWRTSITTERAQVAETTSLQIYEAEKLGARATMAVTGYREKHGHFPATLEAADFYEITQFMEQIWIDADSTIHLEFRYQPLQRKTLLFVPEFDNEGDLIWRCRSDTINPELLPEHCR